MVETLSHNGVLNEFVVSVITLDASAVIGEPPNNVPNVWSVIILKELIGQLLSELDNRAVTEVWSRFWKPEPFW